METAITLLKDAGVCLDGVRSETLKAGERAVLPGPRGAYIAASLVEQGFAEYTPDEAEAPAAPAAPAAPPEPKAKKGR